MMHNFLSKFGSKCLVNGRWIETEATIDVHNPFDSSIIGSVPNLDETQVKQAIQSSAKSFYRYKQESPQKRSNWLQRWSELIDENKEVLAYITTLESGKPIKESRIEVDYANSFIKWFAAEAYRAYGDIIPADTTDKNFLVFKQPVGPCAIITPWNFPLAMITRKCGAALAAGCPVIIKPSKETPFSAIALTKLALEAGFPIDTFQLITGDSSLLGKLLATDPLVRKLTFTGSTEVGKHLMKLSSSHIQKVSLELGGNAPCIVFEDADIDKAVEGTIKAKFRNSGQTCICANRIFVHEKIYESFVAKLKEKISQLTVGNGVDEKTDITALINKKAIEHIQQLIEDAKEKGAQVSMGGNVHPSSPLAFSPTVIEHVNDSMRIYHEEIFGPIASIISFSSDAQVLAEANCVSVGLASYFFSTNLKRVFHISKELEYGIVGVNTGAVSNAYTPFGGVKESGIGREGSKYGVEEFLEEKYVCIQE